MNSFSFRCDFDKIQLQCTDIERRRAKAVFLWALGHLEFLGRRGRLGMPWADVLFDTFDLLLPLLLFPLILIFCPLPCLFLLSLLFFLKQCAHTGFLLWA